MVVALVLSATTALGCVASSAATPPASAERAPSAHADRGHEPARQTQTVTLLTGDQVHLTTSPDGLRSATVQRGPGREQMVIEQRTVGDALYVIPADVAPLVPDVLDRDLFDVAKLADAGYDDARRADLPVILESAGDPSATGSTRASEPDWAALDVEPEHRLQSIGAVSARLAKDDAGDLLTALLATHPGQGTGARAMARAAAEDVPAAVEGAADDVAHVYLDEPVRPTDADSTPQIGAPQAWDAGYTGKGVTVAVLDSGIDPTHPDLDQQIIGSKDFTGGGDPTDTGGHGTHVASIVAGSGEASGGVNRGVAPDANLLAGEVLGGEGGFESRLIDGMEWATAQGADIVNMSVGVEATDGTDPLATALNELTARYDTLFVVAAGNEHYNGTVSTPGSADAALTVGSVDDDDTMAPHSSRGPRLGDGAIKPDVTAPGVGIVAARAAGTDMGTVVDEWYTAAGGTSMASPHVAGAAAVLKSAHPEWGAAELKARLMGSAQPGPAGTTVWDEGAGRVWIPGALSLPVTAQPASLSFGALEDGRDGPATKSLVYTNPSDQDIELALSADFRGPDNEPVTGAVSLSAESLTVPTGGTASMDVTLDNSVGSVGRFSGAVTATAVGGASDGATVRTALGYEKLPQRFDVTIRTVGRDGKPFTGWSSIGLMNLEDYSRYGETLDFFDGEVTVRVPGGTYGATGALSEGDYDAWEFDAITGVAAPEISITRDTTVTLSAEGAMPASVSVPKPTETVGARFSYQMHDAHGYTAVRNGFAAPGGTDLYFTRSDAATTGEIRLVNHYVLWQPVEEGADPAYTYDLAFQQQAVTDVAPEVDAGDLATVRTGYARGPDGATVATYRQAQLPGVSDSFSYYTPAVPGTTRTEYVLADDIEWSRLVSYGRETADDFVDYGQYESGPTSYVAGSRSTTDFGNAVHSSTALVTDYGDDLGIRVSGWTDGDEHPIELWGVDHQLRVWQDGELVADVEGDRIDVPMPQEPTPFRLQYSGTRADGWTTAPQVSGEWEFTAGPAGELNSALPVLDVDYDVTGLGLDGTAPRRTTITVNARVPDGGSGAAATSAGVRWSADDGATWHRAKARAVGDGTFTVTVEAPQGTKQVSLDVEARNAQGSVHETTIGAYLVRKPAAR